MALDQKRWISWIARSGARTVGSLAACVFFLFLFGEGFGPRGAYTLNPFVLTAPGALYLLSWLLRREEHALAAR